MSTFVISNKTTQILVSLLQGAGLTSSEQERLKQLERENFELKRANEILRKAAAFFAQAELDRRPK
jgi:transposase